MNHTFMAQMCHLACHGNAIRLKAGTSQVQLFTLTFVRFYNGLFSNGDEFSWKEPGTP